MSEVTRGNVTWIDNPDGTVTVKAVNGSFTPFTVGKPQLLIELECGHSFKTGLDDKRVAERPVWTTDGLTQESYNRETYHCIRCQKEVKIINWEQ
jgi:hypothetical protein